MKILAKEGIVTKISLAVLFLVIIFFTCRLFSENSHVVDEFGLVHREDSAFPYELTKPSNRFKLPRYLDEISGISYLGHNRLACIHDEEGIIFVFDIEKEEVTDKYKFGKGKDYEDIEVIDNIAYVLQSNGDILEIENFYKKKHRVKRYKTALSKSNDAEGLAFDPGSNSLLVACKGSSFLRFKNPFLKGEKAVYGFDLDSKRLSAKPFYIIDFEYLKDLKKRYLSDTNSLTESNNFFARLKSNRTFEPSGIAIHPKTKEIYLISSAGKMLIVLDKIGNITAGMQLNKKIFKQPEGICFSPEGDLFISNESRDGKANILKFKYNNK